MAQEYVGGAMQVWKAMVYWSAYVIEILTRFITHFPSPQSLISSSFKRAPVNELTPTEAHQAHVNDERHLEKLTVVLDLDETLVSAYETSSLPASVRTKAIKAGLKWFELELLSSDKLKDCEGKPQVAYVTVFERPGLREFLKQTSEFADLILFTAGVEDYARPVVDKIDPENRFSLRLYRPSTVNTKFREHVKDLSCLSKDLSRTVIVDNSPFSFLLQPLNGIPCKSFFAKQPYDGKLLKTILPLLKQLSVEKDVRPVLHEKFQMPEWFRQHGIPAGAEATHGGQLPNLSFGQQKC